MRNKKIEENLLRAYGEMVPENLFEKIEQNIVPNQERTVTMKNNLRLHHVQKWIAGAAAALILVASGALGGVYYANNLVIDSLVDIDVNPSIEIAANRKDKVLSVEAVNEDALEILDGMELKNTDLKVAVNAIIGSMASKGYLQDGKGNILVSVQNDDPAKAAEIEKLVVTNVDDYLKTNEVEASVIKQTIGKETNAKEFAAENKISLGKAVFVLNLAEKDSSLRAEDLAPLSLREIAAVVRTKKIDITDIVDYDADDSLWENIADEIEDTNEDVAEESTEDKPQENTTDKKEEPATPAYIGAEKAKSIALKNAGLTATQVTFTKATLDKDESKYEIEFRSGNTEYDYEIHAVSGKILDFDKDVDDDGGKPANNNTTTQKPETTTPTYIGLEKAKSIALKNAGLTAGKVTFTKAKQEKDDGIVKYDIEFRSGNTEYDYEIHAVSGKILDFDKEIDDDVQPPATTTPATPTFIGKEKAKSIALSHANLSAEQVVGLRVELDEDDGVYEYQVEFRSGNREYEYTIHAESGKILESDSEIDD